MSNDRGPGEQKREGLSRLFYPFLAAIQFLTVAPPIVQRPFEPPELGRAVGYFPLVGVLLGALLVGLERVVASLFPPGVTAALLLASWVALTGALHLDGFLDSCDGLLGGHTPESRMRILQDERVGAFGLAGGVSLLLLKYSALAAIPRLTTPLLLAPALGRWGIVLAQVYFPYGRPGGLGQAMKDHAGWTQAALATAIALATAWLFGGWVGLAAVPLVGAVSWAVSAFALGRIPGLTGDIYGAICEIAEAVVLLFFAARLAI